MPNYLLTGASGFLGKYIFDFLKQSNSKTITLGRASFNNIICDLSSTIPFFPTQIDIVVHAAGKAHIVPKTEAERKDFFDVNLHGTENLCAALEKLETKPRSFVFISTVAVYGVETGENISEAHPLAGNTPYALSKIQTEYFLQNWCSKHAVKLSILRLPLIAGKNPPGNLGAMIRGIRSGKYFNIDGGSAKKSIVMAEDVAKCIPTIAEHAGIYNLTDGYHPSFAELSATIAKQMGKPSPKNIPGWVAKSIALVGNILGSKAPINTDKLKKITAPLTFDDTQAQTRFGWKPKKKGFERVYN